MERILITGASRGIGLELVRQFLARENLVFAGCRAPASAIALQGLARDNRGQLFVLEQDITDQATIDASHRCVEALVDGLDLLINNAGVFPGGFPNGDGLADLNREELIQAYDVNAIGPIMVVKCFLDLLRAGAHSRIINISSDGGSIQNKTEGRYYSYASSKAALNMLTRTLANELRADGIIAVAVHPGWVRTDMGGVNATLSPSESVRSLTKLINGLTQDDTGKFYLHDGREYPW